MKYLIYYLFFILVIFSFAYINSKNDNKEGFTKKLREKMSGFYRPVVRKTRVNIENYKNEAVNKFKNMIGHTFKDH